MTGKDQTRPADMPADTPDYMAPAWASCMHWAIGNAEVRATFEESTGWRARPEWGPAEVAYSREYVKAFIAWANENVWGHIGDQLDIPDTDPKAAITSP